MEEPTSNTAGNSKTGLPPPVRPVDLREVRRKLSSSGAIHPHLSQKAPTSPTSPTVAEWSSDENKSPVMYSSDGLPASGSSPPRQMHQAGPLAVISETDDAGDSEDEEGDEGDEYHAERESGMKGLYSEAAIKSGYLMKKGERRKVCALSTSPRYPLTHCNRIGRSATLFFGQTDLVTTRTRKSTNCCETSLFSIFGLVLQFKSRNMNTLSVL